MKLHEKNALNIGDENNLLGTVRRNMCDIWFFDINCTVFMLLLQLRRIYVLEWYELFIHCEMKAIKSIEYKLRSSFNFHVTNASILHISHILCPRTKLQYTHTTGSQLCKTVHTLLTVFMFQYIFYCELIFTIFGKCLLSDGFSCYTININIILSINYETEYAASFIGIIIVLFSLLIVIPILFLKRFKRLSKNIKYWRVNELNNKQTRTWMNQKEWNC